MLNNIILITVDCLRPDHLNCYGYEHKTSPYISGLAENGLVFSNMYANSSYTCASIASLITSTYPLDYGEYFEFSTPAIISRKRKLLSQVLAHYGYTNAFFHDNPYLSPIFGYTRGFEKHIDFGMRKDEEKPVKFNIRKTFFARNRKVRRFFSRINKLRLLLAKWYLKNMSLNADAETILSQATEWAQHVQPPFFLWCHLMDIHVPYCPSHDALRQIGFSKSKAFFLIYKQWGITSSLTSGELRLFKKLYDLQILHIDQTLEKYLSKLTNGDFGNTIIVVTADHGEEFMENGVVGHSKHLTETLLHVPLIISGGGMKHRRISKKSSLLDVAPTIMDLVGLKSFKGFRGKSLLRLENDRPVIAQGIFKGKRHQRVF